VSERWVLLGLAPARTPWFRDVAQWANASTIAAEFVKCVSAEETRARLSSGRAHSALLVDASLATFDRDLVGAANAAQTPVIAVVDGRGASWAPADLGVAAVLPAEFGPEQLTEALTVWARPIGRADAPPPHLAETAPPAWRARMVAVCGPGGTGASSAAVALAQGLATDVRYGHGVLLADLARCADQAMLHDAGDLGPGVQELVEAHRLGQPDPAETRSYTFDVPARGYRLLLGLRRPEAWAALRPRATDAALDAVRRAFQLVVADVTADLEGESDGGSIDVEERNHLARTCVAQADVIVVVGAPGLKGVHSLARLLRLLAQGGAGPRLLPVVNRAPRNPATRAEIAAALTRLTGGTGAVAAPLWVPERRVDDALRHGTPLPHQVVDPLTSAVQAVLERAGSRMAPVRPEPVRILPGALGTPWGEAPGSWGDGPAS
jgi:hypothetical protein